MLILNIFFIIFDDLIFLENKIYEKNLFNNYIGIIIVLLHLFVKIYKINPNLLVYNIICNYFSY